MTAQTRTDLSAAVTTLCAEEMAALTTAWADAHPEATLAEREVVAAGAYSDATVPALTVNADEALVDPRTGEVVAVTLVGLASEDRRLSVSQVDAEGVSLTAGPTSTAHNETEASYAVVRGDDRLVRVPESWEVTNWE